jgi:hypothetical protein
MTETTASVTRLHGPHSRTGLPRAFRVVLRHAGRRMQVTFGQGEAHTEPPTAADVLECLASDASGFENSTGFGDWADQYGYERTDPQARRTYNAVASQTERLHALLGEDFDAVVYGEDEDEDETTYKIVRFYQDDRPSEVIETGLTLAEAQEHCRREDTHGDGWFDGHTEE